MILDAIIGLFVDLFAALASVCAEMFVPAVNLAFAVVEAVVGLFVAGFRLERLERRAGKGPRADESSKAGMIFLLVMIVGVVGWWGLPKILNREIALVATDGHSLPFAALVVHTSGGDEHRRTDSAGHVAVPRFTTTAITIKDPRYVEKTWTGAEIGAELIVGRTVLGSGLDFMADRLLKAAKE